MLRKLSTNDNFYQQFEEADHNWGRIRGTFAVDVEDRISPHSKFDADEYACKSNTVLETFTAGIGWLRMNAYEENGERHYSERGPQTSIAHK